MKKLASCILQKKNKSSKNMDFTKSTFRVYEIVQPSETLVQKEKYDQIKLQLPGFKKEDIRIKFSNNTTLEVSGERLMGNKKWSSFKKDYLTPENCLTDEIRASFDDGFLRITLPKKIVTSDTTSAEIVDDDSLKEEEKNFFTFEVIADSISEVEKNKESSTNSTITNMTDDAKSITDETEKDAEHFQNQGKDYVDGVKEMKQDEIEDAMSQNDFAEEYAIASKILETDDMTEYAVSQYELVLNMCAAGFVILMLVSCAT
ncbi:inactive protein RESTRICTED TEV MOVEMENT 2-like [Papaver somniferum]|uniref:inactive protein RESTRICTED TEV MOVEMENT 2-like n=1 Tax=Papaver somniferum TaxID=3469 RepID=UPI000E700B04|nr:inactive protein RESTRICTED TEV MOVEMENT 2-like [Papaver somniferum]